MSIDAPRRPDPPDGLGVDFDHHSPEFALDPWPVLADLRATCPVAHSSEYGGFWVITRYEDIKQIALDDETFSSANSIIIPPKKNTGQRSIPIECDPPEFLEYRRVMHPMLSPTAVDRLEPAILTFVHQSIDRFIERGEADLVHELADPVPAMTTLYKLGLPVAEWERFSDPLHRTVLLRQDNPQRAGVMDGLRWIRERLVATIAERRAHPRDDMISYLVQASVFDRPVTDEEAFDMAMLVIQGGFDTTGSSISSALRYLDEHHDARRRLIADPSLIPTAVEELLRYEAPQFALARTATRDVDVAGRAVKAGDRLLLVWASGNRDDAMFDDADTVVLDRFPNRHMTFGLGAHRCLGSTLARRQIVLSLGAVLRRLPDYRIDRERTVRAETIGVTYGTFSMPCDFTPGPRYL